MDDDFDIQRDMGLTKRQQINLWKKIFNVRKPEPKAKKETHSQKFTKLKAIELLREGMSVKDVAKELDITYASANYYKKFL